jgi:hypothetical protein
MWSEIETVPADPEPTADDVVAGYKQIIGRAARLRGGEDGIQLSEHIDGHGPAMFRHACALGLEGIVSKRV